MKAAEIINPRGTSAFSPLMGVVTVAALSYNVCAYLSEAYASCFMIHALTVSFIAYDGAYITIVRLYLYV